MNRPELPFLPGRIHSLRAVAGFERASRERRITPKKQRPFCGAKTASGAPCQMRAKWDMENDRPVNGRCRLHGGNATGPRTAEGRRRCSEASKRYHEEMRRRRARALPPA